MAGALTSAVASIKSNVMATRRRIESLHYTRIAEFRPEQAPLKPG
jgi:hypothetical protein